MTADERTSERAVFTIDFHGQSLGSGADEGIAAGTGGVRIQTILRKLLYSFTPTRSLVTY